MLKLSLNLDKKKENELTLSNESNKKEEVKTNLQSSVIEEQQKPVTLLNLDDINNNNKNFPVKRYLLLGDLEFFTRFGLNFDANTDLVWDQFIIDGRTFYKYIHKGRLIFRILQMLTKSKKKGFKICFHSKESYKSQLETFNKIKNKCHYFPDMDSFVAMPSYDITSKKSYNDPERLLTQDAKFPILIYGGKQLEDKRDVRQCLISHLQMQKAEISESWVLDSVRNQKALLQEGWKYFDDGVEECNIYKSVLYILTQKKKLKGYKPTIELYIHLGCSQSLTLDIDILATVEDLLNMVKQEHKPAQDETKTLILLHNVFPITDYLYAPLLVLNLKEKLHLVILDREEEEEEIRPKRKRLL